MWHADVALHNILIKKSDLSIMQVIFEIIQVSLIRNENHLWSDRLILIFRRILFFCSRESKKVKELLKKM